MQKNKRDKSLKITNKIAKKRDINIKINQNLLDKEERQEYDIYYSK